MTSRACFLLGMLNVPCSPAPLSPPPVSAARAAPLLASPCRLLLRQMGTLSLKMNVPSLCRISGIPYSEHSSQIIIVYTLM